MSRDNHHRKVSNPNRTSWDEIHRNREETELLRQRGLARELKLRVPMWKAALWAALRKRSELEPRMARGEGVDWPEMAPLTPPERTALLEQLRKAWNIPRLP